MSTRIPPALRAVPRAALLGMVAFGPLGAQASQVPSPAGDRRGTSQPIAAAQVNVVGTTQASQTNDQGQFTLRGVAAGARVIRVIRVLRVGFAEPRIPARVVAGQSVTVDVRMRAVAVTPVPW